ncbi:DUF2507 domain-containing protein [Bacillus licheniformis]|nr:DUF2507 domain-containing protein [Bacillus licheniformis]
MIREVLLPDMLGQDYADMMYWAGKSSPASSRLNPGRIFPLSFRMQAGERLRSSIQKQELEFELEGPLVSNRLKYQRSPAFSLKPGLSPSKSS